MSSKNETSWGSKNVTMYEEMLELIVFNAFPSNFKASKLVNFVYVLRLKLRSSQCDTVL